MKKFICLTIVILSAVYSGFSQEGYQIEIKIPSLKSSEVVLGHHFGNALYPDDTVKLDKNGIGVFKRLKKLPGGMYIIYLPSKTYFDILIGDDQKFSITSDTTNFLKTVKFNGSTENQLFFNYQNFIVEKRELTDKFIEKKKQSTSEQEKDSLTKALDKINNEVTNYTKKLLTQNPNLFFTTFLKALQEVEIPEVPHNEEGKITDSAFQYKYYRKHYFDNFDISDARLLHTPLYEDKISNYLENFVPQIADTLIAEIDAMLNKIHSDSVVYRYLLSTLYNKCAASQIMGMDAVFVHIAEKYYIPTATWSSKDYIEKLKKEIAKLKPNLIGNKAPDLELVEVPADFFIAAKTDTALKSNPNIGSLLKLSDIKAKYLIIIFWEADCSHCKKAMPLLHDSIYPRIRDLGVKVLAIHTITSIEGKRKWTDFINQHEIYDFMNAWSPLNSDYRELYNVYTTPTIYVVDKNKKNIAKRIGVEQIEELIEFEQKKERLITNLY